MTTYRVSTHDPGDSPDDDWGWVPRWTGLPRWRLRDAIRAARGLGYDDRVSILVEAESCNGGPAGTSCKRPGVVSEEPRRRSSVRVEVLCGPLASGKSTYARLRASEGALIVCHDDLTQMLHGEYRYEPGLRECYRRMEESLAWAALSSGRDVVVDRTHLTRESRARWIAWVRMYDSLHASELRGPTTPVVAVAFPVLSPEAHARRRFLADPRGRPYEEWLAVAEHHHAQALAEPPSAAEGFAEILSPKVAL